MKKSNLLVMYVFWNIGHIWIAAYSLFTYTESQYISANSTWHVFIMWLTVIQCIKQRHNVVTWYWSILHDSFHRKTVNEILGSRLSWFWSWNLVLYYYILVLIVVVFSAVLPVNTVCSCWAIEFWINSTTPLYRPRLSSKRASVL